jgi:hypothetical protein
MPGEGEKPTDGQLGKCAALVEACVVSSERRWCLNALEHCAKNCELSASSARSVDIRSVIRTVQKLDDDLNRSYDCGGEILKGSRRCVQTICACLRHWMREQSVGVSLRVVSECARSLPDLDELVDAVSSVSAGVDGEEVKRDGPGWLGEGLLELEADAWEDCLKRIKQSVVAGNNPEQIKAERAAAASGDELPRCVRGRAKRAERGGVR